MIQKEKAANNLGRLMGLFPRKKLLIIGIGLTILISLMTISYAFLIKMLIDAAIDRNFDTFYQVLYIVLGLIVLQLIVVFFKTKILGTYTEGGVYTLRELLGKKIQKIKVETLTHSHSGDMISRATNDMAKVRNFTSSTLPELIRIPITALGALILLFVISWKLTLISLIVLPVLIIGSNLLSKPIGPISKKLQAKLGEVNSTVSDTIKGVEVVKAYSLEKKLGKKYDRFINESVVYGKELSKRKAILESFSQALSIVPFLITFILGGYYVSKGDLSVGSLLAFINLLNHLTFPLSQLPVIAAEAIGDLMSASRVMAVIDTPEERTDGLDFDLLPTNPFIQFVNVSFAYPGVEQKAINEFSLEINYNESVAFVGQSGCGKSTLTKLLLGYYDHYEGEIIIGGHELREWNLNSLRQKLSLVTQDTYLFPESIEENIMYGNLNATEEEVLNSAKLAHAHGFIEEFNQGYKTLVGELGGTLSGGQKQRVSIARAILKNTPILILDEATSALDNESESLVQSALKNSIKNKTSIIIAHRLSTIKHVDRIVVLKEGELVELGTHDELMGLNGAYTNLYQKQLHQTEKGDENEE